MVTKSFKEKLEITNKFWLFLLFREILHLLDSLLTVDFYVIPA